MKYILIPLFKSIVWILDIIIAIFGYILINSTYIIWNFSFKETVNFAEVIAREEYFYKYSEESTNDDSKVIQITVVHKSGYNQMFHPEKGIEKREEVKIEEK